MSQQLNAMVRVARVLHVLVSNAKLMNWQLGSPGNRFDNVRSVCLQCSYHSILSVIEASQISNISTCYGVQHPGSCFVHYYYYHPYNTSKQ